MPSALETENHVRDQEFAKAMHGKSAAEQNHFMAWMKKDKGAQKEAVDEYFKHWDNKAAKDETEEVREVSCHLDWKRTILTTSMKARRAEYATLTKQ